MSKIATFTISLSPAPTNEASLDYTTVDGTASQPADYTKTSGNMLFAPGVTTKTVTVPILADVTANVDKAFTLLLQHPVNCQLPTLPAGKCVISTGTGQGPPPITAEDGPLIKNGLITNAYNNEFGRGGYFHPASGTSEGQSIMISAGFMAYDALHTGTAGEQAAATFYQNLSLQMLDALGNGSGTGPLLRQPIPTDPNTITLLHWLFAARADIPAQAIVYTLQAVPVAGKLRIPVGQHGPDVFRVWCIYPSTSELLYGSPYSPAYDKTTPANETQIAIDFPDWIIDGSGTVVITMPASAPSGVNSWNIVYGYNGADTIPQGDAEEAYPCWTAIPDGYASCAPDTFRWFEQALTLAISHDTRTGKAADWSNLRAAMRRSAVRGQTLSDKREVFKPMPGFPAIPASGEPSGMFCYSTHPAALPPSNPDLNQNWIGYAFWSRATNGDVLGQVPTSSNVAQVQLGRGFNDSWRAAAVYQDPDQFLWVSLSCTKKPSAAANEHFYIFVSSTKYYSGQTRWYADIGAYASFVAVTQSQMNSGMVIDFMIPLSDFKRKDLDNQVMTVGTTFQNFGISAEMSGAYNIRLKNMRMLSGVSAQWVQDNFTLASKGSQLPFFPGAMPFDISADTVKQQFIGYSGNPFHGYQLPDFWYYLGADAGAVHGTLTQQDLPTADPTTGAVVHIMSMTTQAGTAKTQNALLMEQQLRMLQAAQNRYHTDGGPLGPFAHTFVINTPDRINIGSPQPGTWVYTNDDPNTRWIGYQCRVVESLAMLCLICKGAPEFQDCVNLAMPMVVNFLTWLRTAWPNLNGTPYKGMPTQYDDPRKMPNPVTDYEEPHGPALIMRACMHLKLIDSTHDTLCDALINQVWAYLETQWVSAAGEMQYTWSPDPEALQWYGFWEGEIITTLCYALANPAEIPAGFPTATVRQRLVQTQQWLASTGVKTDP